MLKGVKYVRDYCTIKSVKNNYYLRSLHKCSVCMYMKTLITYVIKMRNFVSQNRFLLYLAFTYPSSLKKRD